MRHTNLKKKDITFSMVNYIDEDISLFKFVDEELSELDAPTINTIENFFKVEISTPDEDCYLIIQWGSHTEFMRVGNPPLYVMLSSQTDISYKQFDYDGSELDSGDATHIDNNFYYINPSSIDPSFFVLNDRHIITLVVPSCDVATSSSGRIHLQENAWQMIAINVEGVKVKEYLLDKLAEICDTDTENIVKRVSAYFGDENKFTSFIPAVTDSESSKNFELVRTDASNDLEVKEITAFWIKMLDYKTYYDDELIFEWDSADGE